MSAGFPRHVRLTAAKEYKKVFAEGRRVTSAGLVMLYRENGRDDARLGLAISKKHVKYAVHRNTVKRQVREFFRRHQGEVGGLDIVVLSRAALGRADKPEVGRQLGQLWRKLLKHSAGSS